MDMINGHNAQASDKAWLNLPPRIRVRHGRRAAKAGAGAGGVGGTVVSGGGEEGCGWWRRRRQSTFIHQP